MDRIGQWLQATRRGMHHTRVSETGWQKLFTVARHIGSIVIPAAVRILCILPNGNRTVTLGDFNRHHSAWEGANNAHLIGTDRFLNPLLDLIVNMRLEVSLRSSAEYPLETRNTGSLTKSNNVWRSADTPP